ncbi:winged helix-turn-helix transcriptional regulator [Amycolatopsis kentuckyensis]|uniref:winged helix-turn-helix transcriptional regulator n=1 Tax=Amycolatopsis kentuckyensis TaxID=218823 RepID=UPI00356A7B3E
MIEGRWKLLILHHLFLQAPRRFSELRRAIPAATEKMLIQQLRALEADGIVHRKDYAEVPPRVEYSLTAAGAALEPALDALHDWAASEHLATTVRAAPLTPPADAGAPGKGPARSRGAARTRSTSGS